MSAFAPCHLAHLLFTESSPKQLPFDRDRIWRLAIPSRTARRLRLFATLIVFTSIPSGVVRHASLVLALTRKRKPGLFDIPC